ncbi:MAG: 4Fe-4S dicluster domain-containing protein [Bacteroidota bacterium]
MSSLFALLEQDVRFREGLIACMNCGVCTAICPAAEFYNYDPRMIVETLQRRDEGSLRDLLSGETIWYCGQCMSCKTRCPRGNVPGMLISALRELSQRTGLFVESEKGRQQYAIKKSVGENILKYGYCIHPEAVLPALHPEQGPVWKWIHENRHELYERLGGNLDKEGAGVLRKISKEALLDLKKIFDVTGNTELFEQIEKASERKAREMGLDFDNTAGNEYWHFVYTENNEQAHTD